MSTLFLRLTLDNNVRIRKEYPQTKFEELNYTYF